ncbi:cytochrome c oxidase subunit 3 [bacterium]|nr:cytochrome c oxidase subunit 3 [bacterium]
MEQQADQLGKKLGMWLFLYTEIMLFGGLFVIYANYYHRYTADFVEGGRSLALVVGAVNTILLLASSYAVAASITAIRREDKRAAAIFLGSAIVMGLLFLVNKYFEWGEKFSHDIYPGSPHLADGPQGLTMFYGLYFTITGLHGLHVAIGVGLLMVCSVFVLTGRIHQAHYVVLENSGLFWHLIDLIWIFIFPLFYLIL